MSTLIRTDPYDQPIPQGAPVYEFPFNDSPSAGVLVTQRYKQNRSSFLSDMQAGNYDPGDVLWSGITNCYVVSTSVPTATDTGLQEFTRLYATKPATRTEWESMAFRFPGYDVVGTSREPFTLTVPVKVTYTYYLVGSFGGADESSADDITLATPYAFGGNYLTTATSPTQASYASSVTTGGYTLTVDASLSRWHGCIYEAVEREIVPV